MRKIATLKIFPGETSATLEGLSSRECGAVKRQTIRATIRRIDEAAPWWSNQSGGTVSTCREPRLITRGPKIELSIPDIKPPNQSHVYYPRDRPSRAIRPPPSQKLLLHPAGSIHPPSPHPRIYFRSTASPLATFSEFQATHDRYGPSNLASDPRREASSLSF